VRSHSVFRKTCPSCATQVPTDSHACACGHIFAAATEPGAAGAEDTDTDDELFRAYLRARIDQAVSALEAERIVLAADPKNFDKAYRVMRALHDVQALRNALQAHMADAALAAPSPAEGSEPAIPSAEPSEAFRTAQAVKAARIMQQFEGTDTKECPNCHQTLPVGTALCLCGYAFGHEVAPPAPFTTPGGDSQRSPVRRGRPR
jgi:hypothetical protein